ncbi:unnamed protein product [Linum tenue]|uniref:Enoyl reductase (ER) domain-containing protein n=1 Tax=Linum tenue TaxID=586396 RepID=A0AAV0QEZ9_9ROSI|nr:unnamed protein product [Linum tenue]
MMEEALIITNRSIVIKTHINGFPKETDFELKSEALSLNVEPGSGHVIVKNLYLSIDPAQLNRMKSYSTSQSHHSIQAAAAAIAPGSEIRGHGVGKVVASGDPEFQEGDLVAGELTWGEYCLMKPGVFYFRKLDSMGLPLSCHVGTLAYGGMTAYAGLFEVCKVKKGEKVFVSAAAGSVGHIAGQLAKLHGCYVVGSAGTTEKVELLKGKLGFDDAFNYKEEADLKATLRKHFPHGIDVYFDSVGGEMLEAAVANMNLFGRVAACGAISEYTGSGRKAAPDMVEVIYRRIQIQGFLCPDFLSVHSDFISATCDHLRSEKMVSVEDISTGLESIPSSFAGLFHGSNIGKTIVQIAVE